MSAFFRLAILCGLCALASASVDLGSDWPAFPLDQPAEQRRLLSQVRAVQFTSTVVSWYSPKLHLAAQQPPFTSADRAPTRVRRVQDVPTPPSGIGMYHVILWSSLGIAVTGWFAVLALFNMDVGHDSLLYSKVRAPVRLLCKVGSRPLTLLSPQSSQAKME
jgi:hypothetical protein